MPALPDTTTADDDPVGAVVDLLSDAPETVWTDDTPPTYIERFSERSQQTKENRSDPAIYVWRPGGVESQRFSADGDTKVDTHTIMVEVWYLQDKALVENYRRDAQRILEDYEDDHFSRTPFQHIIPQSAEDRRHESPFRHTSHYLESVTVEVQDYRASGPG